MSWEVGERNLTWLKVTVNFQMVPFKSYLQLLITGANFVNIEAAEKFLSSAERQSILLHFLNSMRAEKGESVGNVIFREGEAISKMKISSNFLSYPAFTKSLLLSVPKCVSKGVLWQVYPLHDADSLETLQKSWVKQFLGLQPLGKYLHNKLDQLLST